MRARRGNLGSFASHGSCHLGSHLCLLPSVTEELYSCKQSWLQCQRTLLDDLCGPSIIMWTPKSRSRGQKEKSERFSIWGFDVLVLTVAGIRTQEHRQWMSTPLVRVSSLQQPPEGSAASRVCILPTTQITRKCFPGLLTEGVTVCHLPRPSAGAPGEPIPEFWPGEL